MSAEIFAQLENASTDEEMLIALSLLPRTNVDLEECFGYIKWQFIHRLLISEDEDMSTLGLHIWTKFYQVGKARSKWLKRIPAVVKLAKNDEALQTLISALTEKKSWGFYTSTELHYIASLDSGLSLFFVETLVNMEATLDLSMFLSTCARIMLRGDSLIFHALAAAVKILAMPSFKSNTLYDHLLILNLACRRIMSSKLSKETTEVLLMLLSLLSDRSDQSFLDINFASPKDIELEEKLIKEAEEKAMLTEYEIERLIENMESLQQSDPDADIIRPKKTLTKQQFIVMVAHLTGAEIRFMLDTTTENLSGRDRVSLPMLYYIMEDIIKLLLDYEKALNLGEKILESIRKALGETFMAVGAFLAERWDMYSDLKREEILDNDTTLFSFTAYSAWVSLETPQDGKEEEMERLVPLVIWMQSKRNFQSTNLNPNEISLGLMLYISSEQLCLDSYLREKGLKYLVPYFASLRDEIQQLNILAILLNIIFSSEAAILTRHFDCFSQLMIPLELIITSYTKDKAVDHQLLLSHSMVCYLFLYRSSKKYQSAPLPLVQIFNFIAMRSKLDDEPAELWYLAVSALCDCAPALTTDIISKSRFTSMLSDLLINLDENDSQIMISDEINTLKRQSSVSSSPFMTQSDKIQHPAKSQREVRKTAFPSNKAKYELKNENKLISKERVNDLGDDKSVGGKDWITGNLFNESAFANLSFNLDPSTSINDQLANNDTVKSSSPTKGLSMMDILRNFDSTEKEEHVLYSSTSSPSRQTNIIKMEVKSSDPPKFANGVVDDAPLIPFTERQSLFGGAVKNQMVSPTLMRWSKSGEFGSTVKRSASGLLQSKLSPVKPQKSNESAATLVEQEKPVSLLEKLAMFENRTQSGLPVLNDTPSTTNSTARKLRRSNSLCDRLSKFEGLATNVTPTAPIPQSKQVKHWNDSVTKEFSNFMEPKAEIVMQGSKTIAERASIFSQVDDRVSETPSMRPKSACGSKIMEESEFEGKRSDSGVVVSAESNSTEIKKSEPMTLELRKIEVGSMFDETEDNWISSLLNDSVDFEEAVKEINETREIEAAKTVSHPHPGQNIVEQFDKIDEVRSTYHSKAKKSVSFGVAWKNSFESVRTIPAEDVDIQNPVGTIGQLLLKFNFLEDIIASKYGSDRILDFEVSQGNQCVTSPPISLKASQSKISIDWECYIALVEGVPLHFTLKIRELCPSKNISDLKRVQSTKAIKKGIQSITKLFGMNSGTEETQGLSMNHSESCTSFSSISSSGFVRDNIKTSNQLYEVKTAQHNVIYVSDWIKSLLNIDQQNLTFYQNEWDKSKNGMSKRPSEMIALGKLQMQALFMPADPVTKNDLLPITISEYRDGISLLKLHRKIWKEGYLYQKGGDCENWRRRYFKLTGDCLVAHHETTIDPRATICLLQLDLDTTPECISGDSSSDSNAGDFTLSFKDGRAIQFRYNETGTRQDHENGRNEWLSIIQESHHILKTNVLPPWL